MFVLICQGCLEYKPAAIRVLDPVKVRPTRFKTDGCSVLVDHQDAAADQEEAGELGPAEGFVP